MLSPTPKDALTSLNLLPPVLSPLLSPTHPPVGRGGESEGQSKSTPKARARAGEARARAEAPPTNQNAFQFHHLTSEMGLAAEIFAKTGRDLFKGVTLPADRQAAARIAIIMNRLEGEFGAAYHKIYGEPLPERRRIAPPETTSRGKDQKHGHDCKVDCGGVSPHEAAGVPDTPARARVG